MNADIYDVIHRRRDVRAEFTGEPIPEDSLGRILAAAHAAPSVGLSQPWDFIIVGDPAVRRAFYDHVQHERATFAATLTTAAAGHRVGLLRS
jgi:5,6-dimethylbenzimidazole synthase